MPAIVFELLFALFTAVCGLAGGWYVRGLILRRLPDPPEPAERARTPEVAESSDDRKTTREALTRLQEMAVKMAADVGQHNTRVQEINAELSSTDVQTPENVVAAVAKVLEANERMQQQLSQAEQRLNEQARQIESHVAEARTDALTGVSNRRAFDDQMQRCLEDKKNRYQSFCVMMIDIDFFKKFNDTHGHLAGDHVLKCVAAALNQSVGKLETVARYGGEEFAVVFRQSNLAASLPTAERARAAIAAAKINFDGKELQVTASAGLAEMQAGESIEALIKRADAALYDSKKAGRNCGHWHDGAKSHPIKTGSTGAQNAADTTEPPGAQEAATRNAPAPVPARKEAATGERAGKESTPSNSPMREFSPRPQAELDQPKREPIQPQVGSGKPAEESMPGKSPVRESGQRPKAEHDDPKREPARRNVPKFRGAAPALDLLGDAPVADVQRDQLTGLSNRETFHGDLERRVAERKRGGAPVSSVLLRIDRLDELSAEFGPASVDVILKAVTQYLKGASRDMDYVARYDADMFALLLPGTELAVATQVAERLRRAIEQCRLKLDDRECRFTVSLGLAEARPGESSERLLEHNTRALEAASGGGGNRSFSYTGGQYSLVANEMPVAAS
jgi:diguanylate cyclase